MKVEHTEPPRMMTIRQAAAMGPLSEYALRLLLRQGQLPGLFVGRKFLINYDRLIDGLNHQRPPEGDFFRPEHSANDMRAALMESPGA